MIDLITEYYDYIFLIVMAIVFTLATKKCFIKKRSVPKIILTLLLSPPMAAFIALDAGMYLCSEIIVPHLNINRDNFESVFIPAFALSSIVCQLFFCAVFVCLYLAVIRPRRKILGVFVYLMYFYLTDLFLDILMNELSSGVIGFYTVLTAAAAVDYTLIYIKVIRPLSELTDRNYEMKASVFITIPAVVLVFSVSVISVLISTVAFMDDELSHETILIMTLTVSLLFISLILILSYGLIVRNTKYTMEVQEARDNIKKLSVEVMEALAHTIDAKDKYTNGHSVRVAKYSRLIAEKLGLSPEEQEDIYYMGLLHDIGKIGVPNEIINKPSRLTDAEYDIIKNHPVLGYEILSEIKSRPDLAVGAHWHHERYDGRGYPDKIAGEDIPFLARIIAVADSYDAMTSNRSYRQYLPQEKVISEIENGIGTQFDPVAAKCMLEVIADDKEYVLHE